MDIEPDRRYQWDVKVYHEPQFDADTALPVNGSSIDSYYSAFSLPICEIREFS
jgi:hypothetical protein